MGFKVKYHNEAAAFLCVMIIATSLQAQARVNVELPTTIVQEETRVPLPNINDNIVQKPKQEVPEDKSVVNPKELNCMAEAVYYESKNESIKGQKAVGHVILNRTKDPKFPKTICKVVNQKNDSTCQFSYKCEGKGPPKNKEDFAVAKEIAADVLEGERDITHGALYFHNLTVKPLWAKASKLTMVIGNHKFYRG